jgi:hypothetical protein
MRSNLLLTKAAVLSGMGLLALGATAAHAAPFTINLISTAEQLLGGAFVYQVDLADNESLVNGDFISIFDFGAFGNVTSTQAGFVFNNPLVSPPALAGPTPGLLAPPPAGADDPGMANLQATYTGTTITGGSFNITAQSPFADIRADFSYGQTSDLAGVVTGKITTVTPVETPGGVLLARPAQVEVIPEPGTVTLLGMGALGALGMVRRRRAA